MQNAWAMFVCACKCVCVRVCVGACVCARVCFYMSKCLRVRVGASDSEKDGALAAMGNYNRDSSATRLLSLTSPKEPYVFTLLSPEP